MFSEEHITHDIDIAATNEEKNNENSKEESAHGRPSDFD